jgi:general secretion pathway protein J
MRHGRQAGFTLLEVMLAVALFALVAVGAITAMNQAVDSQQILFENEERLTQLQKALFRIERDLLPEAPRPIVDPFGAHLPAFQAPDGGKDGYPGYMEFTRSGWDDQTGRMPRSNMQRVAYRLNEDKLEKLVWLQLDRAADAEPQAREILNGIKSIELRFWAGGEDKDWPEAWPIDPLAEYDTSLPYVVEMVLDTEDMGKIRRLFRLSIEPEQTASENNGRFR